MGQKQMGRYKKTEADEMPVYDFFKLKEGGMPL